jgi:hypothetical protein
MATLDTLAPELSQFVDDKTAIEVADRIIAEAVPAKPKTLGDLTPSLRSDLLKWLRWFGVTKVPSDLPSWIHHSPAQVAGLTGMSEAYIMQLIAERNAIVAEVGAYADKAFRAHPRIESLSYAKGDLTITGVEFLSVAGGAMGVRLFRAPDATTNKTKAQIEAQGGKVTDTSIVVKASSIPLQLQAGDQVTVVADGLDSNTVALALEPEPKPEP